MRCLVGGVEGGGGALGMMDQGQKQGKVNKQLDLVSLEPHFIAFNSKH